MIGCLDKELPTTCGQILVCNRLLLRITEGFSKFHFLMSYYKGSQQYGGVMVWKLNSGLIGQGLSPHFVVLPSHCLSPLVFNDYSKLIFSLFSSNFPAKHHGVPFYIAAPSTTVDLTLEKGSDIVIEERPAEELTTVAGVRIAAPAIGCWNPAFDVTPAELITGGIVTEYGVFKPSELKMGLQEKCQ